MAHNVLNGLADITICTRKAVTGPFYVIGYCANISSAR
jgi:hypothetical protein